MCSYVQWLQQTKQSKKDKKKVLVQSSPAHSPQQSQPSIQKGIKQILFS